jgi:hypothetical protein
VITRILIAGVAIAALCASGASAKARHHHAKSSGSTYAAPAQPIPYAELDHYLRASRSERRSIEMAAAANTGNTANTAATTPETAAPASGETTGAPATNPPTATPDTGAANPPSTTSATPGAAAGGGSGADTSGAKPQPR